METTKKKQDNKALNVAKALIMVSNRRGIPIDHLKLQKLLYFAQALSLVRNKEPLFTNRIYAWDHGPVVKTVWEKYNKHKKEKLSLEETDDTQSLNLSDKEMTVIEDITETMKKYSGIELRKMTHKHYPWKEVYQKGQNKIITNKNIQEYYKNILT